MTSCASVPYYNARMAMGKRKRDRQPAMWGATTDLLTTASHPFYVPLDQLLGEYGSTIVPKRSAQSGTRGGSRDRPSALAGPGGGSRRRIHQPSSDSRGSRQAIAAATWRAARTDLRARV